jgi:hypothetical protein
MRFRPTKVLAAAWLVVALGLTLLIGPHLGWRGWIWLGLHDLLALVGGGWELWGPTLAPLASRLEQLVFRAGPDRER